LQAVCSAACPLSCARLSVCSKLSTFGTRTMADAEDVAFRAELMITFYHEAVEHLTRIHGAAKAFKGGADTFEYDTPSGHLVRPIEQVIKDEAHAVKGSAATLDLNVVAEAASDVEVPAKQILMQPSMSREEKHILLEAFCVDPCDEVRGLLKELHAFVRYFRGWVQEKKSAGVDVAVELEASEAERLKQVSCEHFEGLVVAPFAELWGVDVPSLTGVTL